MSNFADRVRENCTIAAGIASAITLTGAVTGFAPFSAVNDGPVFYCILTSAGLWEIRTGTKLANAITPGAIHSTSSGGAAVSLPAGTHQIYSMWPSYEAQNQVFNAGQITAGVLPVARGGTGRSSISTNGILAGNNAGGFLTIEPSATPGHVLTATADLPEWAAPAGGGGVAIGGAITGATAKRLLYVGTSGVLAEIPSWEFDSNTLHLGGASTDGGYLKSFGGGTLLGRSDRGNDAFIGAFVSAGISLPSASLFGWSAVGYTGDFRVCDTGLSRISANVVGLGNGMPGNTSGKLTLTILNNQPLTVGTLPVGAAGDTAIVVDAISDVRGSVVAAGGALFVRVLKDGANWRVN